MGRGCRIDCFSSYFLSLYLSPVFISTTGSSCDRDSSLQSMSLSSCYPRQFQLEVSLLHFYHTDNRQCCISLSLVKFRLRKGETVSLSFSIVLPTAACLLLSNETVTFANCRLTNSTWARRKRESTTVSLFLLWIWVEKLLPKLTRKWMFSLYSLLSSVFKGPSTRAHFSSVCLFYSFFLSNFSILIFQHMLFTVLHFFDIFFGTF